MGPSEASLGIGVFGTAKGPGVTLVLGNGKPEPLAMVLELQPRPNWTSQFLQNWTSGSQRQVIVGIWVTEESSPHGGRGGGGAQVCAVAGPPVGCGQVRWPALATCQHDLDMGTP